MQIGNHYYRITRQLLNLADIKFPMILKDISRFEHLKIWTWCRSTCTASKISRSFLCDLQTIKRRNASISCIYKIHITLVLTTLCGSRTCRISCLQHLTDKRTRNTSVTDKYNKKKINKTICKKIVRKMIFFFTGASITSARAKNGSRTKWTAGRSMTALYNCQARTTGGSNLATITRNEYHL